MKRRIGTRIVSLVLCLLMIISNSITAFATEGEEVIEATSVLVDVEEAQETLEDLLAEQEVPALLYMKDIYTIKAEPSGDSDDVASISGGQQVWITGVDEDEGHNIWYQVSYRYDEGEVSGYIERTYLAFSDERLLEWEGVHILSMRMWARRSTDYGDVEQFPQSYQAALYKLKQQHPNWKFVKFETGLDWNRVVNLQSVARRSLIPSGSGEAWKESNVHVEPGWVNASDAAIKYYLDPRNSLAEKLIFQFEQLTYNASYHSKETTQMVLNGTFMEKNVPGESMSYADAFMHVAVKRKLSPIMLAARVRQEQGNGKSGLISGKYPGYEGYYNYFNIKAAGQTTDEIIRNGLAWAKREGWNTPLDSLMGGSEFLANKYINQGQDTLYLQKFDVDSSYNDICWHQYMTNIKAPTSEANSTYNAYSKAGIVDAPFVFKIPVFRNMPSYACTQPGSEDKITLNVSSIDNLPVDGTVALVSYINGSQNTAVAMNYTSSDEKVAKVDNNGVVTGIKPGEVTITCVRAENPDGATTATCKVKVIKGDISVSDVDIPEVEVAYSPTRTLEDIDLPDGFDWLDDSIVPVVGNSGYSVSYNPDEEKYNTVTLTVPVLVNKAVVDQSDLSLPRDLTTVAGAELRSVALPDGYTWDDAFAMVPKKAGTYTYTASYCMDIDNYEVVRNITLTIEVICKTHEFGEWEGNHATCTEDGELIRTCSICDETEKVVESAVQHEYSSEITKEPSILAVGIRTYTCIKCGDTYEVEIPVLIAPHKHDYNEEVTVEPTCEKTGIKTFVCDCEDVYTETIEELGHDVVDGACTRCDYKVQTLPEHVHSFTFFGSSETCTEDGVATYTCGCGESYTEETKALGHDMKDGECTRCDYEEKEPEDDDTLLDGELSGGNGSGDDSSDDGDNSSDNDDNTIGGGSSGNGDNNNGSSGDNSGNAGGNSGSTGNEEGSDNNSSSDGNTNAGDSNNNGSADGNTNTGGSNNNSGNSSDDNKDGGKDDKPTPPEDSKDESNNNKDGSTGKNESTGSDTSSKDDSSKNDKDDKDKDDDKKETSDKTEENKNILDVIQNLLTSVAPSQSTQQPDVQTDSLQNVQQPATDNTTTNKADDKKTDEDKNVEASEEAAEGAESEDVIEETEDAVKITMKHSTMLNTDKLAIVSESSRKLELVMADNVKWKVDLSDVEDINSINVDMEVKMNEAEIPQEVLATLPQENPAILMSLSHEGPFEFEATLEVPVNKLNAGKYANLFYYNPTTGEMEFIAASLVTEEGTAEFLMEHASDYAIVLAENSMDPNPPAEEAEEVVASVESTDSSATGIPTVVLAILIVAVVAFAILGIVFGVRFLKKKSDDHYYFDEEDESPEEMIQ